MNELSIRISNLPQVLQDYIGMYNVEHRQMMKSVCQELRDTTKKYECQNGCGCSVQFKDAEFRTIQNTKYIYCGWWCSDDHFYSYKKAMREWSRR